MYVYNSNSEPKQIFLHENNYNIILPSIYTKMSDYLRMPGWTDDLSFYQHTTALWLPMVLVPGECGYGTAGQVVWQAFHLIIPGCLEYHTNHTSYLYQYLSQALL